MTTASLLRVALVALFCTVAVSGQTKSQPQYQITGVLVSSADGSPIPHGQLVPTLVGRGRAAGQQFPAPVGTFDADEHGRFVIPLPSAGAWDLTASARGFARQAYQEHEEFSTAVVLTNEAPTMDLRFALNPEADITGVVLDEAGEAVRRAQVSLVTIHPPSPDNAKSTATMRTITQTDDRGAYEFAGLPGGSYRICVQAQPWYAVAAQSRRLSSNDPPPLDPSLDVTYALTWFPGVDDPDLAETLTLHAGDNRQADFHLLPIPSIHLLLPPSPSTNAAQTGRSVPVIPLIQRIGFGTGGQPFVSVSFRWNAQGQINVGGLSPGLYQIRVSGTGQETHSRVVKMTAGSIQTLDLDAASSEARVTMHLDGLPDADANAVQVNLIDPESDQRVVTSNPGGRFSGGLRRRQSVLAPDRIFEVPPGRYEIVLQGRPDLYLTGISAKGAEARGRVVTVPAGESSLTLHIAGGRATLTGVASFQGKPSVGAMVMLVPTTIGDAAAIPILRRDQSNTDGSFDLPEVIPGEYILIAIDHGWEVNWSDASTLRRYLTQGVPLDLTSGGNVKQNITVQAP